MARNNWARDAFRKAQNLMSKGYDDFEPTSMVTKQELSNLKTALLTDEQIARDNEQQPAQWYQFPDENEKWAGDPATMDEFMGPSQPQTTAYAGEEPVFGKDFNLDTVEQDAIDYEEKNAYRNKDPNRPQSDFDKWAAPDELTENEYRKKQGQLAIQAIQKQIENTKYGYFTKMTPGEKAQRDERIEELTREKNRLMEIYRARDWAQGTPNEEARKKYNQAGQYLIDTADEARKSEHPDMITKLWNTNKDKLDPDFVTMLEETVPELAGDAKQVVDNITDVVIPGIKKDFDKAVNWIDNLKPLEGFISEDGAAETGIVDNMSDDMEVYMDMLRDEEGFEPVGINKFNEEHNTIGYGHNGPEVREGMPMNKRQAENLLRQDIEERLPQIKKAIPKFNSLPMEVKRHIVSSWFRGSLSGSPKTIKLINAGQYAKAADEFLDNHEYKTTELKGVKKRMKATADALRSLEGR